MQHQPNRLSSLGLTYDGPCGPMECECIADAELARTMLDRLRLALPLDTLDVFVLVAGDATHAFMVAHCIAEPAQHSPCDFAGQTPRHMRI